MKKYDVAAYFWPAYTGDEARALQFWKEGIGEWQSVKNAVRKFSDHNWPRKPLWGYVNEADPKIMEMEINIAADHGINVFIYDWYWYDGRPFLEQCLDNGYLKARNNDRVKFYLMWANHNANNVWNIDLSDTNYSNVIWNGSVDWDNFKIIVRRVIDKYFTHPSYYKINGEPVFMIYELPNLINGLGGMDETKNALTYFREETIKAGFPGLHLQLTAWGQRNLNFSGVDSNGGKIEVNFSELGFNSITNYQFAHFVDVNRDYDDIIKDVEKEWAQYDSTYSAPYFPHISVGWDNNPRFKRLCTNIMKNNTPGNIEKGLWMAKKYIDNHPDRTPLITINSWNEWTETSYLEPDNLYGYGYLEAVKKVFMDEE